MTDIVEEARALLAKVAPHAWSVEVYGCVGGPYGSVVDGDGGTIAETWSAEHTAFIAAAPRLLAALADECERLSTALDAMTNQAVMASGRRATIVTEDGELERLRAENARLREAMPSEVVEKDIDYLLSCIDGHPNVADEYERVSEWLARLDAAKEGR